MIRNNLRRDGTREPVLSDRLKAKEREEFGRAHTRPRLVDARRRGAVLSRRLFMANFKPLSVAAVIINKRHYGAERTSPLVRSLLPPLGTREGALVLSLAHAAPDSFVRSPGEINTWDQRRSIARGSFTNEHSPITSARVMRLLSRSRSNGVQRAIRGPRFTNMVSSPAKKN